MTIKDLWTTEVGSMMWGMFKPGISDHDYITIRQYPTRWILEGRNLPTTWPQRKNMDLSSVEVDQSFMEIGHLINLLIKGNINAIWAVMSPVVISDSPILNELREIVKQNPSKLPYHSIRGMATSQKLDETKRPRLSGGKGYRTAARTSLFGAKLLEDWTFDFKVPESIVNLEISIEEVDKCLDHLDYIYQNSQLPDAPCEQPFREFLYRVRMHNLEQ